MGGAQGGAGRFCDGMQSRAWVDRLAAMTIQQPRIPASAVVMRVVSILGMGLTFSAAVLLLVAAEWLWAGVSAAAFVPFLVMMYLVDRMIPDLRPGRDGPDSTG